jgi:hypothetical protein
LFFCFYKDTHTQSDEYARDSYIWWFSEFSSYKTLIVGITKFSDELLKIFRPWRTPFSCSLFQVIWSTECHWKSNKETKGCEGGESANSDTQPLWSPCSLEVSSFFHFEGVHFFLFEHSNQKCLSAMMSFLESVQWYEQTMCYLFSKSKLFVLLKNESIGLFWSNIVHKLDLFTRMKRMMIPTSWFLQLKIFFFRNQQVNKIMWTDFQTRWALFCPRLRRLQTKTFSHRMITLTQWLKFFMGESSH